MTNFTCEINPTKNYGFYNWPTYTPGITTAN